MTRSLQQFAAANEAQQEANAKLQQQFCGYSTVKCPQVYRAEILIDAKVAAKANPEYAAVYAAGAVYPLDEDDEIMYCTDSVFNYELINSFSAESGDSGDSSFQLLDDDAGATVEGPKEIARLKADEVWVRSHPEQMRDVFGSGFQDDVRDEVTKDEQEIASTQSTIDKCASAKSRTANAYDELQRISDETMQRQEEKEQAVMGLLNQLAVAFQQQAEIESQNAEEQSESFRQGQELGHEQQEEFERQQQEHSNAEANVKEINERQQQLQDFLYGCFAQWVKPSDCPAPSASGPLIPPAGYELWKRYTKPPANSTESYPPSSNQF